MERNMNDSAAVKIMPMAMPMEVASNITVLSEDSQTVSKKAKGSSAAAPQNLFSMDSFGTKSKSKPKNTGIVDTLSNSKQENSDVNLKSKGKSLAPKTKKIDGNNNEDDISSKLDKLFALHIEGQKALIEVTRKVDILFEGQNNVSHNDNAQNDDGQGPSMSSQYKLDEGDESRFVPDYSDSDAEEGEIPEPPLKIKKLSKPEDAFQNMFGVQSDTVDPVNSNLAEGMIDLFRNGLPDSKFQEYNSSIPIPSNLQDISSVRINQFIWNLISKNAHQRDERFQVIQNCMGKTGCGIATVLTKLKEIASKYIDDKEFQEDINHIFEISQSSLGLLGHGFYTLLMRRRELIKPELAYEYKPLCSSNVPVTTELFGDDVEAQLDRLSKSSKVAQKVTARGRGLPSYTRGARYPTAAQASRGRGRTDSSRLNYRGRSRGRRPYKRT